MVFLSIGGRRKQPVNQYEGFELYEASPKLIMDDGSNFLLPEKNPLLYKSTLAKLEEENMTLKPPKIGEITRVQ